MPHCILIFHVYKVLILTLITCCFFCILAVKLMTDWKLRQEWDKTATVVDVLDRIGNFKVVYK